jgi:hypothetical protein
LRVALLSTLEPASDVGTPRGLLRVGGRALVEHQLGMVLACGCQRLLCVADGFPGELIALQQLSERAGMPFRVVSSGHDLARLVAPQDELLVIAAGLLAPAELLTRQTAAGPIILVQSAEDGLVAGYERIDLNHADAGVIRLPGTLVSRLAQLPSDWNPYSALLRIAAQGGVAQRELPVAAMDSACWTLIRSEAEAQAIEPVWLRLHTCGAAARGPGSWLAAHLVQRLGPALLHAGTRSWLVTLAALLLALGAGALGWAGWTTAGFLVLGMAWLIGEGGALLARVERSVVPSGRGRLAAVPGLRWLIDAVCVLCCTVRLGQSGDLALAPAAAVFAALVLFGMVRLVPRLFATRRWAVWFDDRFVASLLLVSASASRAFAPAMMAASLLMIAFAMVSAQPPPDETATAKTGRRG